MHKFFEKIDVFNNIQFIEKYHRYTIGGVPTVSVTKVTGSVKAPFNAVTASQYSVKKYNSEHGTNITPEELQAIWGAKNIVAAEKGTAVHKFLECALSNKFEFYPAEHISKVFGDTLVNDVFLPLNVKELYGTMTMRDFFQMEAVQREFGTDADPVKKSYDKIVNHVKEFLSEMRGRMFPIKSEVVIGSPKYLVCGMVDQIFYNIKTGQFEIWDWKTNSEFDIDDDECKYLLSEPLGHIKATKLNEYSLQLACYKKMFQEMTGIQLGQSRICWFSELEPKYRVFPCKPFEAEAEILLTKFGGRTL